MPEKTESLEQAAREFVKKFMHDASGPHTGSYETDAEAWPGSGLEAEDFVKRLTELLAERERQVWTEAAKIADASCYLNAPAAADFRAAKLAETFRARGEQVK